MRKEPIHHCLKVTFQKKLLNLRLPPTLDYNMAIEAVDSDVRAFWRTRVAAFKTEIPCKVVPQCFEITFRLLNLGLLLGTTGFCDEVYWELV
jgi:hypothetical protein